MQEPVAPPARSLSIADAVFVTVGIVVGAGIFRAPSLVAANSGSDLMMLSFWLAGGVIALVGALCYAELASTYPSTGGDYHFLRRAFGRGAAFLFGWARLTVMQTGSIALLAYIFGDYFAQVIPLGLYGPAIYASAAVVIFTGLNLIGLREGKGSQWIFTVIELAGVVAIALVCLLFADGPAAAPEAQANAGAASSAAPALGLAMVFVLLTYGGWNEGAYVSAEIRGERAPIVRVLLISIFVITGLYLLINVAYLNVLGREGMAASEAVAADAVARVLGEPAVALVSLLVAVSALTSMNATIITGARCNHALGRDFEQLRFLSRWNPATHTPTSGFLVQGVIALVLVVLGALTRSGFATLVEYTAPVFWCFFLLTGLSLLRLRQKEPGAHRPFRVPLYPLTPIIFCATSAYMLWSSVSYTGIGALVGVAVLLAGLPVLWVMHRHDATVRDTDTMVRGSRSEPR